MDLTPRGRLRGCDAPVSIYELHLGSWGRTLPTEGRQFPTYEELAEPLAAHALAHGFTHVELMPVMEHPFYGSWGYQVTGYFAPTGRYGHPTGLMRMIDHLHQKGIGVIFDWVPSHFPNDPHGLAGFDGTHLFEHADPRQGFHPEWKSAIFNYGRLEVRSFLIRHRTRHPGSPAGSGGTRLPDLLLQPRHHAAALFDLRLTSVTVSHRARGSSGGIRRRSPRRPCRP